ncbi:MAG: (4Fe-4S)-binding protein [Clostridia bacterium]|nr:(4Fe-4S)-binding protein [Clostridia bacterium]
MACTVAAEDVARVKGLGFLRDKNTPDCFNARVLTRNGKITAEESEHIAEAARRFGSGEIAMTTRQTVEIQKIPYENIEPLCAFLAEKGLKPGGTGPKVRPVVSCKGTTCVFGLIDTYALSEAIHHRFYEGMHDVKLPHKFKIAVGGCPNNCVKPDLNDIGVIGQRMVQMNRDLCRGCKTCQVEKTCPMKAAAVNEGVIKVDGESCSNCGRCWGKCPFGVCEEAVSGYKITLGGRWGKKTARGTALSKVFTEPEEVLDVIEKAILFYRDNGMPGERFADTIARIGFAEVERQLLGE